MNMKHYLSVIILAICLISCNSHSHYRETLSQMESYIEERPDSALAVLKQMNASELSGKEEKAKHALLYSMALDKNVIDKTDFEVLQPAIDYFENNGGSATDKMRTYYYQGRIYQNQGNDAFAMECFVSALSEGKESDDKLTKARILFTQGGIYNKVFEWDKCISTYNEAGNYFQECGRTSSYINCIASIINVYTIIGDVEQAEHYIIIGLNNLAECSMWIKGYFYSNYIIFLTSHKPDRVAEVRRILDIYLDSVDSSYIDWLSVSYAYLNIGDMTQAMEAIKRVNNIPNAQQQVRYYALLADIHKHKGEYEKALDGYLKYVKMTDSLDYEKSKAGIEFIEERHSLELKNIQDKERSDRRVLAAIGVIIIFLSLLVIIRYRLKVKTVESELAKQEKEKYRLLYNQIEQERDSLTEILERSNELEGAAKNALLERLTLLNRFFLAYITDNRDMDRKVNQEMEKLVANKEVFMYSTRLAFAGSHPKFIKHLEDRGLNEWEINYCCLYALGLKGKEIGEYIQLKSHFNNSSDIRKKLGLGEHDVNLGTYIRKLLRGEII